MEITLERETGGRRMRISGIGEGSDGYALRMLAANRIPGLMPMEMQTIDNESAYYYTAADGCSLEEVLEKGNIEYRLLSTVYSQFLETLRQGEEYLLPDTHYVLRADTIFLREKEDGMWKVETAYHTGWEKSPENQLAELTEYLMEHVNHKDKRAVRLVYGIYGLLREEGCTRFRIQEFLDVCGKTEPEDAARHVLPKELETEESVKTESFVMDLETARRNNIWNATMTVASALGMVACIAVVTYFVNLPPRALVMLAAGAVAVEVFLCNRLLRD